MNRLEEAPARFEPPLAGRPAEQATPRRLGRVLARNLARLGPLLEGIRGVTVSLAIVALLFVVGWSIVAETRRVGIVVDRIEVPRSLEERGLRGEVLASRLIDAIAETSAAAYWRGERKAVAAGWKTADVQVPALGVTMGAIVRMVEEFVERPDQRVGGELVQLDHIATLRLRISPPRASAEPIVLPIGPTASDEAAIDTVLGEASRRLLERIDPVALAAHRLASRLERLPGEAAPAEALDGLEAVIAAVNVCLVDARCREEDGAHARLIWATAAWRAARRIRGHDPETAALLVEEGLGQLDRAAWPEGEPPAEAMLRRADLLLERGDRAEAFAWFERAARARPRAAGPRRDWAKALARIGEPERAAAALEEAIALEPRDPWLWFELGKARRAAGRDDAAIEAFREATRLDARLHCAFEEWGRALESTGRVLAGQRRLQQAELLRGSQPHCTWPDP